MDGIIQWLWMVSWQVILVAAVVWIITRLSGKAPAAWRYALWTVVLVKFFVPPFAYLPSELAFWQNTKVAPPMPSLAVEPMTPPSHISVAVPGIEQTPAAVPAPQAGFSIPTLSLADILCLIWLAGILIIGGILLVRYVRQAKLLRNSTPAEGELAALLADAAERMKVRRLPKIMLSDKVSTPVLVGVFRPVILLPPGISDSCSPAELSAMFIHELAHIKRWDMAGVWLNQLSKALFFFHPAIWLAGRELRKEREIACDELVISSSAIARKEYAEGYIAALRLANRTAGTPVSLAMAEPFDMEKRRLNMILHNAVPKMSARWVTVLLVVAAIVLPTFVGVSASIPQDTSPASQSTTVVDPANPNAVDTPAETINIAGNFLTQNLAKEIIDILQTPPLLEDITVKWEIVQCDETPSVDVEGRKGYRILLRRPYYRQATSQAVQPPPTQTSTQTGQEYKPMIASYSYVDLVLFPVEDKLPKDIKKHIPWSKTEQEKYYMKVVDMGEGRGVRWFGRMVIQHQEVIREKLGLTGGDNRLKLLADGLKVKEDGRYTADSVRPFLWAKGDKALPYIEKVIRENHDDAMWGVQVMALGGNPGEKSTRILRSLYASKNQNLSKAAAEALVFRPFKKSAKNEYFDMLRKEKYANIIPAICVEFRWKDALPLLKKHMSNPEGWETYRMLFEAKRKLEGKPGIPKELLDAEETIMAKDKQQEQFAPTDFQVAEAKNVILNHHDRKSAVVIATSLALFNSYKISTRHSNSNGIDIFRLFPKADTRPVLDSIRAIQKNLIHRKIYNLEEQRINDLLAMKDIPTKIVQVKAELYRISAVQANELGIDWEKAGDQNSSLVGYGTTSVIKNLKEKYQPVSSPMISITNNILAIMKFSSDQESEQFSVLPRVNNADNTITLTIEWESQNTTSASQTQSPEISKLMTTRRIANGESIIIGGIGSPTAGGRILVVTANLIKS